MAAGDCPRGDCPRGVGCPPRVGVPGTDLAWLADLTPAGLEPGAAPAPAAASSGTAPPPDTAVMKPKFLPMRMMCRMMATRSRRKKPGPCSGPCRAGHGRSSTICQYFFRQASEQGNLFILFSIIIKIILIEIKQG